MSFGDLLAIALVLGLERICYVWIWRHADTFQRLCARPGLAIFGQPVDILQKLFYGFKAVQLTVFLWWCMVYGQVSPPMVSSRALALGGGTALIVAGQVLNFMVFYRLGKIGVFYGNKFGHTLPRCSRFPFSLLRHPQYVGAVSSIWGFFLAMRFPQDDWYLLPALETLYYVWGAHFEQ